MRGRCCSLLSTSEGVQRHLGLPSPVWKHTAGNASLQMGSMKPHAFTPAAQRQLHCVLGSQKGLCLGDQHLVSQPGRDGESLRGPCCFSLPTPRPCCFPYILEEPGVPSPFLVSLWGGKAQLRPSQTREGPTAQLRKPQPWGLVRGANTQARPL